MKIRSLLTAAEVAQLHDWLGERLDRMGIETQPELAVKILELTGRSDAQLQDYAKVIKTDPGLSGRLLKLSNSALFAQRRPVTSIDRACLLLGIERLKSVSLGFHLSRAAAAGGGTEYRAISREVWGQGVMRACLAAELARHVAPQHCAEAFVVGLMIDAGVPLMARMHDGEYAALYERAGAPGRLYRMEFEALPMTHVDVAATLVRKWRLPELLARPIELHHTKPPDVKRDEPVFRLHRIAYVVGLIELGRAEATPSPEQMLSPSTPGVMTAARVLGLQASDIDAVVRKSVNEYGAAIDLFDSIAGRIADTDTLLERVGLSLVGALDSAVESSVRAESARLPERFLVGGQAIEVARESDSDAVAYLFDSRGQRLMVHRFSLRTTTVDSLLTALGVRAAADDDTGVVAEYLKRMCA
jgi:HD-like signal output (HDOD) protein